MLNIEKATTFKKRGKTQARPRCHTKLESLQKETEERPKSIPEKRVAQTKMRDTNFN